VAVAARCSNAWPIFRVAAARRPMTRMMAAH
jgi:hypothetical protein